MYDTGGAGAGCDGRVSCGATRNFDSDMFEIVIDGYHDHLSRAFFSISIRRVFERATTIGIGNSCCDQSWESDLGRRPTHVDGRRMDGGDRHSIQPASLSRVTRCRRGASKCGAFIKRNNEQDQWAFWRKERSGRSRRALWTSRGTPSGRATTSASGNCCRTW